MTELALLNIESYPYPAREYETKTLTLPVTAVQRDDVYNGMRIAEVSAGPKWVTLKTAEGKTVARCPNLNDYVIPVQRTSLSDATRKAEDRASLNRMLVRDIEAAAAQYSEAQEAFSEHALWAEGNLLSHKVDALLLAAAELKLWNRFRDLAHAASRADAFDGDLVDVVKAFVDELNEELLSTQTNRALSRSTSQTSNLLDDVDRQVAASFLRRIARRI